jgi:hypothetical protein
MKGKMTGGTRIGIEMTGGTRIGIEMTGGTRIGMKRNPYLYGSSSGIERGPTWIDVKRV